MTRPIKFRAWDIKNQEMVIDGVDFEIRKLSQDCQCTPMCKEEEGFIGYAICPNFIMLQSTGIKDFDKVEIYEGDVIELTVHDEKFNLVCIWGADASFHLRRIDTGNLYAVRFSGSAVKGRKVIGNIYSNPELLEGSP